MMDYPQTLEYIFNKLPMYQRKGKAAFKKDLTNIIALSEYLDNPHTTFKSIHIAGTNGKGSTAHIIAAILQNAGYKVGLYSSPHYKDFRERIKINGTYISESAVIEFVEGIQNFIEEQQPSFFEITVGMAFDYFRKEAVDIAIIETGLGGRLDSTNIIHPELSIISNIGFDHVDMLGDTLAKIAFEKAGIIKAHTPVIIGEKQEETSPVFEQKAQEKEASLSYAEDFIQLKMLDQDLTYDYYQLNKNDWGIDQLAIDLKGPFQLKNLQTALAAIQHLNRSAYKVNAEQLSEACKNIRTLSKMMGRWDILQEKSPLIISDSAHNAEGLRYVLKALREHSYRQLHIVFGMVKDKNPDNILKLLPKDARYYFAKADIPRGLDAKTLQKQAALHQLKGELYPSVLAAFQAAKEDAQEKDLIFVGGSIFVVAEILAK